MTNDNDAVETADDTLQDETELAHDEHDEVDPIVLPMVRLAVTAVSDVKAEDIRVIDVEGRCSYCDLLVVCTGKADRHVRAIAGNLVAEHKRLRGKPPLGVEGLAGGRWVLVDLGDVLVHIFDESSRGYYDIDGLWLDAREVGMDELGLAPDGSLPRDVDGAASS